MLGLVVGWDRDIDVSEWGVGIAEGDDGAVYVTGLLDWLVIGQGVGYDDQTWLTESTGDVIGKGTRGKSPGDGLSTGQVSKLEGS